MKEDIIKEWFHAWFNPEWNEFYTVFESYAYYSESWGPEYSSITEIMTWFENWHSHFKLINWNINQFIHSNNYTIVEWHFSCENSESIDEFDGCSIIEWSDNNKILSLKEYSSLLPKYNPFNKVK